MPRVGETVTQEADIDDDGPTYAEPAQNAGDVVTREPRSTNYDPRLISFVERLERLEQEKKDLADDIKVVIAEAKADGYDVKQVRNLLKLRADPQAAREFFELQQRYAAAVGIQLTLV